MNFNNVNASAIANIYFDGKVVSHSLTDDSGSRITLGLIYPGTYHFNTESPEKMEITSGSCDVTLDGEDRGVPGVWFYSLDTNRWIACKIGRKVFQLPYFWAED